MTKKNTNITITRAQFFDFIRRDNETLEQHSRDTAYYLKFYDRVTTAGSILSWNWSAFLVPAWWVYRRMYIYALGITGLSRIIERFLIEPNVLGLSQDLNELFESGVYLFTAAIFGSFANYMYLIHAQKKIMAGVTRKKPFNKIVITAICLVIISCAVFAGLIKLT